MSRLPQPAPVSSTDDVRRFFDHLSDRNDDRHDPEGRTFTHRLEVLDRYADFRPSDTVLDLGTGNGRYLRGLADRIGQGIGIDLSPQMIRSARRHANGGHLRFRVDDAEKLRTIGARSIDKVIAVGVLEHVLHPERVIREMRRVLRPGGRAVILTLNGQWWWYRLADRLGVPTRHLSTDRRPDPSSARRALRIRGFETEIRYWRFVPEGDLPPALGRLCHGLESLGRLVNAPTLRSGLVLAGRKTPGASR